ncbi:MAG: hypothetical protein CUN54_05470 [Phototrophicales bacterium]|nr:MAG: hypothetical protein CUN54_05470 [Phototrophicales bacterium]
MQLNDYLAILWRRRFVLAVTAIVATGIIAFGVSQMTTKYAATSTIRVETVPVGGIDFTTFDISYSERLMNTYTDIFRSPVVMDQLAVELDMDEPPDVTIDVVKDTELLIIGSQEENPDLPPVVVNTLARLIVEDGENLLSLWKDSLNGQTPPIDVEDLDRLSILQLAEGTFTVGANKRSLMAFGALVGLLGGIGMAFVVEHLDQRIYSLQHFARVTNLPILSEIPKKDYRDSDTTLFAKPRYSEGFRRIKAVIKREDDQPQVIMLTSPEPGEGKSTIAANLALSLAQSGERVMVIDMDTYRPSLHKFLALPNDRGLSTLMLRKTRFAETIQKTTRPQVTAITSGPLNYTQMPEFDSPAIAALINQLRGNFDFILLDTPPTAIASTAKTLMPLVDSVIVVVRMGQTNEDSLRLMMEELSYTELPSMGIVVNAIGQKSRYRKYYKLADKMARNPGFMVKQT